jgi:hypothetical protein
MREEAAAGDYIDRGGEQCGALLYDTLLVEYNTLLGKASKIWEVSRKLAGSTIGRKYDRQELAGACRNSFLVFVSDRSRSGIAENCSQIRYVLQFLCRKLKLLRYDFWRGLIVCGLYIFSLSCVIMLR